MIVGDGFRAIGSVTIDGDKITRVDLSQTALADISTDEYDVVPCQGKFILPGVIDEHVHFRDPGMTEKGTIASESRAAVAGGVTSFFDMPNTNPQTVTIQAWEDKMEHAANVSAANYAFFIGATNNNLQEILSADRSLVPGVKLFMGSSTGGMLVDDDSEIRQLFTKFGGVIACHAESEAVIARNRQLLMEQYPDGIPVGMHSRIRSSEACYESTARAVKLARETHARLHVMHITTADELALFAPGDLREKHITAETCPHYLCFTEESVELTGGLTKCNPALKTEADRQALLRAIADGRIDVIATDHAPHLLAQKMGGTALTVASGMPSVQFSLPIMLQLTDMGYFSIEDVVRKMSAAPAQLFGIAERGFIQNGCYADLVVVDPNADYTITRDCVLSPCGWSPYEGMKLHYRVEQTWVNGALAYANGEFTNRQNARALKFNY